MSRHEPEEHAVSTLTIDCAQNGITESTETGSDQPCATLADLEEFCADIRRHGGQDDLVIKYAADLSVTLGTA